MSKYLCLFIFILSITIFGENQEMKDINKLKGYWLTQKDIFWDINIESGTQPNESGTEDNIESDTQFFLYNSSNFIDLENTSLCKKYPLVPNKNPFSFTNTHPHLATYRHFQIENISNFDEVITGHCILVAIKNNQIIAATGIQMWGLLDDCYFYSGELGVVFIKEKPNFRIWAPTAKNLRLCIYKSSDADEPVAIKNMQRKAHGIWEIEGETNWNSYYYLYEVTVFVPKEKKLITSLVTDPYSVSLSTNSTKSQITDLSAEALKPENWDNIEKPVLNAFTDISIYELHIRDFSIADATVPDEHRGSFLAFTHLNSNGMKHLREHAKYGLTHLHLLPVFDIATIEEDKAKQKSAEIPDAPSNSHLQQEVVSKIKDEDGFNWGYDPFHYGVPEGSYATNPDGERRILEMREMVSSLNKIGLRVIMDVVYNHTHSCGQNERSVLDKIVPDYYYRLDKNGFSQNSSCCPDTASEHKMMEKLMIDTLIIWAKHYKIDGFRFDLMGHHTTDNLNNIRNAFDSLTPKKDGVDGKKVYLYGEGWTFGSLHYILPNQNMDQRNGKGLGIGMFNDRMRDSLRGGNFEHRSKSDQGFINGLYYDYNSCPDNAETSTDKEEQRKTLINYTNNIRICLAGGLSDFAITDENGKIVHGYEVNYRGNSCGYTAEPQECINYVSAHDNYSLWDQICAKAPFQQENVDVTTSSVVERTQMQVLGLSCILLGQGIPFIHAGSDMLRSKSGDGDSYNSGDWFNKIDFSYQSNGWGIGLPIREKNFYEWDFWHPRLVDPNLIAHEENILTSIAEFRRLLKVRYSSSLFRLPNAAEIKKRVSFLNAEFGTEQIPGLIVMSIDNKDNKFEEYQKVIVLWNANKECVSFSNLILKTKNFAIHPALLEDVIIEVNGQAKVAESPLLTNIPLLDSEQGIVILPPRSTVVLVQLEQ